MRILLVEDEDRSVRAAISSIEREVPEADVIVVGSRDEAVAAVRGTDFDLVLCDIRLPPHPDSADVQEAHGLSVHAECRSLAPGTPLIFLTGFATSRDTGDQLALGEVANVFGVERFPLVSLIDKDDVVRLEARLAEVSAGLTQLSRIEIRGADALGPSFRRAVALCAVESGHDRAEVTATSGLSGSSAGLIRLSGDGQTPAAIFVKVGGPAEMADEYQRYRQHVANRLAPGLFAPTHAPMQAGLGSSAALVSTLADRAQSLFGLAARSPEQAAEVVGRLRSGLEPWTSTRRSTRRLSLAALRRLRLPDDRLQSSARGVELASRADRYEVDMRELICHGDLHGENVLVGPDGRPVLIDFGDSGPAVAASDPVTLELSLVFHRSGAARRGPAAAGLNWAEWADVDRFASGSLLEPFIRATRRWAMELADEEEVLAFAYAHALRQLKYPDVDEAVALEVASSAVAALGI